MDVAEFLRIAAALDEQGVDYVLVGAVALSFQGLIRATQDIDLFVKPQPENVERLKLALGSVFGDPSLAEIRAEDLAGEYAVIRYGPPDRDYVVDIISHLGEAWRFEDLETSQMEINGVRVRVATPRTLYRMKRDTLRLQDRADAEALREKFHLEDD